MLVLLAAAAWAETVSSSGLPDYVAELQARSGCVVVVAVPREAVGDARAALGVDVAVKPVDPEDWDAFVAAPDVGGRCVAAVTPAGVGRWEATFLGGSPVAPPGPDTRPRPAPGTVAAEVLVGFASESVGALIGDLTAYSLFRSPFLKYDEPPRRTVAEAWGAGVGAAAAGAAGVWAIGALGRDHGSLAWTAVGSTAGIGLGAVVLEISDHDGAIADTGTALEILGAPVGATIANNATLRWDPEK